MANFKLTLAYEGTRYLGWQKTKMGPSIEEELEKAIAQILHEEITLQAASRTDAGVHAACQIVNFFTKKEINSYRLKRGINALLPKDISVLSLEEVEEAFHPTLSNIGKEYHYHICNGTVQLPFFRTTSWHFSYPLCIEKMKEGAKLLTGVHDFSAFCNDRSLYTKDTVREIFSIDIDPIEHERLRISVRGNHFLYKMVRNIAGTLIYVGCGKIAIDNLQNILKSQDRKQAGVTAPAHGLTLKEVFYNCAKKLESPLYQEILT